MEVAGKLAYWRINSVSEGNNGEGARVQPSTRFVVSTFVNRLLASSPVRRLDHVYRIHHPSGHDHGIAQRGHGVAEGRFCRSVAAAQVGLLPDQRVAWSGNLDSYPTHRGVTLVCGLSHWFSRALLTTGDNRWPSRQICRHLIHRFFLSLIFLTLSVGATPGVSFAQFGRLEVDARTTPWSSLGRMALEGGFFPPAYRPVTGDEIATLLDQVQVQAMSGTAVAFADDAEYDRLLWLRERHQYGGGGWAHHGCDCKIHPPHFRVSGRMIAGYSGLANTVPEEGGLGFFAGNNIYFEPELAFAAGDFWAVVDFRIGGRVGHGGVDFSDPSAHDDPLTWPDWVVPTGRAEERALRLDQGAWHGQVTRALVGLQLGHWALSAGWDSRRTGPGLTGDLNLDYKGRPFAALTARRTASFQWRGVMTHLAPDQLLLRTGLLSQRRVAHTDEYGLQVKDANPVFMQWLVGWNVTSWFRTHVTHTVMASPREGTLWPDLLQLNFPVIGTTWREGDSGPITDRIFAVQFEFRWREAPWPRLSSLARYRVRLGDQIGRASCRERV